MSATIENIRKNCMGTISFDMKAKGMRKPQDFIVYPINGEAKTIYLQSDKKWVEIDVATLTARISKKGNTSACFIINGNVPLEIEKSVLEELFDAIRGTAKKVSGNNGILYCDNSNANKI